MEVEKTICNFLGCDLIIKIPDDFPEEWSNEKQEILARAEKEIRRIFDKHYPAIKEDGELKEEVNETFN